MWRSGWDKIFYFVGTNTFSQKFRPKQRESDATKGVQNSGNLGINLQIYYISINASFDFFFLWQKISFCDKKFLTVALNSFLWQEVSFCDKKFLLMPGNFFLWQDISASDKKFLPVTRNFFLWQEIYNCGMKFLPLTKSFFLWQEISSNAKKFLPETRNFFLWQENISCMLCVIGRIPSFDRKYWYTLKSNSRQNSVNCCKNFVWARRFRGNLAPWFPGNIPPWSRLIVSPPLMQIYI